MNIFNTFYFFGLQVNPWGRKVATTIGKSTCLKIQIETAWTKRKQTQIIGS